MHIEAIVIRKRPVREHDQMVVLYSRELGKVHAIAKGSLQARSRQALALDEGCHVVCELIDGRTGPIMTGTQAVGSMRHAKRSARTWAAVQFFLQTVDVLVYDAQPDEALWSCVAGILDTLEHADPEALLMTYRTGQLNLLQALGYGQANSIPPTGRWARTELDERFELIAQRKLSAIDLLYDVAALSFP